MDRFRFDNYDDYWNVKSKPHHHHKRHSHDGEESEMNGDPNNDMPILTKYILKNVNFI